MSDDATRSPGRLILVPAVITLGVTLLRLWGELQNWSPRLFSRAPGGGGALVGISWLVLVFGAWFGWKVARSGSTPRLLRGLGLALVAFLLMPAVGFAARAAGLPEMSPWTLALFALASVVGLVLGFLAWPALGRVLLAYAFAARVPVALLMLAAIFGDWGTHYDVAPPGLPPMGPFVKWVLIGLLPQMTIWIWFTVVVGTLVGLLAAAVARLRPATPA